MRTVFLSYRRSDTGGEAGRLADVFLQRFGDSVVFRDIADIPPGAEFDAELERELAAAKVVLVLIGPRWLPELRERLEEAGIDYVRLEIAGALRRRKRVIPILIRGAALPSVQNLPSDLFSLAKHQAMSLRDESWTHDVDRLIDSIGRPYPWRMLAFRAVIALVVIVVAVKLLLPWLPEDRANDVVFLRVLIGSLAGFYGLVEGVLAYRHFRNLQLRYRPDA